MEQYNHLEAGEYTLKVWVHTNHNVIITHFLTHYCGFQCTEFSCPNCLHTLPFKRLPSFVNCSWERGFWKVTLMVHLFKCNLSQCCEQHNRLTFMYSGGRNPTEKLLWAIWSFCVTSQNVLAIFPYWDINIYINLLLSATQLNLSYIFLFFYIFLYNIFHFVFKYHRLLKGLHFYFHSFYIQYLN